jgi:hypothetical protein
VACGARDVGSGQPCGGKFGAACHAAILLARGPARLRDRLRRDIYAAFTVRSLLPLAGAPRSAPVLFRLDDATLAGRPKPVWQFPKFGFAFKARRYGGLAIQLRDFVGRCYFSRGRHHAQKCPYLAHF